MRRRDFLRNVARASTGLMVAGTTVPLGEEGRVGSSTPTSGGSGLPSIRWERAGRVISPENGPEWRSKLSGMAGVLPIEDSRYRVFLTGRNTNERAQVGWLDMDDEFHVTFENPGNPVLTAGRMGCFDCQGVCAPCVIRLSDSLLYMYYVGWGPSPPDFFVNNCGLAVSSDNGRTWRRWSEAPLPVLDGRDPIGIGTVFPLRGPEGFWRIWYTTFTEWQPLPNGTWRPHFHIKYAESEDGIHWRKPDDNIALDFKDERECVVSKPMVIKERTGYRMWFSHRNIDSTYRIGYAESVDGRHWRRLPSGIDTSPEGWDSEMIEYAYVIKRGEEYVMFYSGNGFGASGTGAAIGRTT